MVNIKGLDKAEVLMALFNNSKIQGFNANMVAMGLMKYPEDMTKIEAEKVLHERFDLYFDYYRGKVMKVDLSSDEEFDERLYDRDNGKGSAQKAINSLRKKTSGGFVYDRK